MKTYSLDYISHARSAGIHILIIYYVPQAQVKNNNAQAAVLGSERRFMDFTLRANTGLAHIFIDEAHQRRIAENTLLMLCKEELLCRPAAFTLDTGHKVIVATIVAETSLTIPGVKCLINYGMEKKPPYSSVCCLP